MAHVHTLNHCHKKGRTGMKEGWNEHFAAA